MTLDPAGLEAAAKALSHDEGIALWDEWTPAAQSDLLTAAEAAIRAYLTAAGRAAAPDDDDGPFREDLPAILQSVRDGQGTGHYEHPVVPLHIALAAVTRAEAAGRAAATPDPPHTPDCSANMLANFADCSCAATPDPQDEEACLRWTCESCGWNVVVPMPGYAGDGHYHYGPPQNTRCGPLVARREGFIRALPGADLLAAPSHGGDEAAGTPTTVLNTEPSSAAASPDERLREALALVYVMLTGAEPMWAEMPLDERCARAANEAQQAVLAADREAPEHCATCGGSGRLPCVAVTGPRCPDCAPPVPDEPKEKP